MAFQLLQIFAKAPIIGKVKTRLAVDIGDQEAKRVYESILLNTVKKTTSENWQVELWCTPDKRHPFFKTLSERYNLKFKLQSGLDLGERMLFALQSGKDKARKVVLIGADCPDISTQYIEQAFNAIETKDVVFGPVEDGGYALVGCRNAHPSMFKKVRWGSTKALSDNISSINRCGLSYELLPKLWDLDTAKDLLRWQT